MPLFEITSDELLSLQRASFETLKIHERQDLQRLFAGRIDALVPDVLVIAEEFCDWEDSKRRIDLLALDRNANLVVIELKRSDDSYMDLQAIRYSAMVSTMTFEKVVDAFGRHLDARGDQQDPREAILSFLDWDEPDDDRFAQDVRIVLAASEFSRELTSAVIWLNERGVDIRCMRLQPYSHDGRKFLDVQQVLPLPEAEDYQVRLREKASEERSARSAKSASGERYLRFWTGLLEKAQKSTNLHSNISPGPENWIADTASGLAYSYVISREGPRAELYISRFDAAANKAIFHEIARHKESIESSYGGPLSWQPLVGRKACRIAAITNGEFANEADWDGLQERLVNAMNRLESALRPYAKRFRDGAKPDGIG